MFPVLNTYTHEVLWLYELAVMCMTFYSLHNPILEFVFRMQNLTYNITLEKPEHTKNQNRSSKQDCTQPECQNFPLFMKI